MSSHVFTAQDNTDKLTIRAYKAEFGRPQTDVVSSYLAGLADPEASR